MPTPPGLPTPAPAGKDAPRRPQGPDRPGLRGRDIVCVGFADWDTDLWTNQHHLMARLARENRVLFVESLGLRQPQLAGRDLARIARRLRRGLARPRAVGLFEDAGPTGDAPTGESAPGPISDARGRGGLFVLSPLVVPLHGSRPVRALNARLLPLQVLRATRWLGMARPILWGYVPQAELLVQALDPSLVVYHCVDDIAAHGRIDTASFRAAERRFAARAELVLASAPKLAQRLRGVSANVLDAPNVADTELFAQALLHDARHPPDAQMAALPRPRIVFTGAIVALKLDFELLLSLARMRPSWSFALVGPVGPGEPHADVSALEAQPNIHLLGPRAYRRLPEVLRAADAGLIPYAGNELTASIFPMKVYEYLAAGLPVVATPLPALEGVAEVTTAADAQQVVAAIERALAEDSPERRAERSRAAAAHSWERRLQEIAQAIAAAQRR